MKLDQNEWSAILVGAWHADKRVGWALMRAGGHLPGQKVSKEEFSDLKTMTQGLVPDLSKRFYWYLPVRALLARFCRHASEALWAGDEKAALSLIERGGIRPGGTRKQLTKLEEFGSSRNNDYRREKTNAKRTKIIRARSLSKWHDWKTVK